jgi:hypothetical protein
VTHNLSSSEWYCRLPPLPQCPADIWSLTYQVSFWKDSYCPNEDGAQAGACNSTNTNRPAACDLDVPLQDIAPNSVGAFLFQLGTLAACPTLFPTKTTPSKRKSPEPVDFRTFVCECLQEPDEDSLTKFASGLNAVLNFDFNATTAVIPADVQPPKQCSNATFVPARNLYVCDAEGVTQPGACKCPKRDAFYAWDLDVPVECFEFVAAAAEGGKCLAPAAAALSASSSSTPVEARCRISSCSCPEGSPAVPV